MVAGDADPAPIMHSMEYLPLVAMAEFAKSELGDTLDSIMLPSGDTVSLHSV